MMPLVAGLGRIALLGAINLRGPASSVGLSKTRFLTEGTEDDEGARKRAPSKRS